jgi:acetate kinase
MKILVANIGSTSLKYRLYELGSGGESLLARGGQERVTDYAGAIEACLSDLAARAVLANEKDLAAVAFKTVVARGVTGCVRLDEAVLRAMADDSCLAPAHNPPYIAAIRGFMERMPSTPLVGLFEPAFFQFAPESAMAYAVPAAWRELGVRRLGFHGASHKYVAERSAELLGRPDVARRARDLYLPSIPSLDGPPLRVISCHLGGSSSIAAIENGAGVGTSMGLSPQSGLPQNNRVGDLDAFAIPLLVRTLGLPLEEIERLLCKESGLKGLSGGPNDMRDIEARAAAGDERARLSLDVFAHQARHWIGAHLAALGGTDALVFTAGIGENAPALRARIVDRLAALGIALDPHKNAAALGQEAEIGAAGHAVRVFTIPTNEELVVAREARRLLEREAA